MGWAGGISILIDPLSDPPEVVHEEQTAPEHLLETVREMMERTDREAYLRIRYGHRSMTNRQIIVYIQRWPSAQVLREQRFRDDAILNKPAPKIGDQAHWDGGPYFSSLSYSLDEYLVSVKAWASDELRILRMAEVIEAKLAGRSIPPDAREANPAVGAWIGHYRGDEGDSIIIQGEGNLWWVPAEDPYVNKARYVGQVTPDSKSKQDIGRGSSFFGTRLSISDDGDGITTDWPKQYGRSPSFKRVR